MKIGISGICGKMGSTLYNTIKETPDFVVTFGVDKNVTDFIDGIFVYCNWEAVNKNADVIIDFSNHAATPDLLNYCLRTKTPLVIGSTGQTTEELMQIYEVAKKIPILISPNTSLGATYLTNAAALGANFFGKKDYEINIAETHHSRKVDSPSGTAIALANAVLGVLPSLELCVAPTGKRQKNQLTVNSTRIGEIIGQHEISFAGNGEMLTIKHEVLDRRVFALGALECAKFIQDKPAALYKMTDMIKSELGCNGNCKCHKSIEKE